MDNPLTDVDTRPLALILGAGVNGSALARELSLNGVGVVMVDTNDIAFGATSKSSRLIHGGLRYLEYAEFRLVRESLAERARLRRLAPQFVEPLELFIPVDRRFGGLRQSIFRFFGWNSGSAGSWKRWLTGKPTARGLWLVRAGLGLYDWFARDSDFPRHTVHRTASPQAPAVDAGRFHWMCAYYDAQMRFPERFVLALLADARASAAAQEIPFHLLTRHRADITDAGVQLVRLSDESAIASLRPQIIVNATGAWGDLTLEDLHVESPPLFGGTRGSHLLTADPTLRAAIGRAGVYAEAADGRLVFVLPFGDHTLVGTTDVRFDQRPEEAHATSEELTYLREMVNDLFPDVNLQPEDVAFHYSGVRPLPRADAKNTSAVSRDHRVVEQTVGGIPLLTLVGGKLTTARALGEEVADMCLTKLGMSRTVSTRDRAVPGAKEFPADDDSRAQIWKALAERTGCTAEQVRTLWPLIGNRLEDVLPPSPTTGTWENLRGTHIPLAFARHVIAAEWATTLDDLIERRLMLLYDPGLSRDTIEHLAALLVEAGHLPDTETATATDQAIAHLREHYGKHVR